MIQPSNNAVKSKLILTEPIPQTIPDIGRELLEKLPTLAVKLIPLLSRNSAESIRSLFPDKKLIVCDFFLEGAQNQLALPYGFEFTDLDILNIDHHAPHPSMYRPISSGNLAAMYRKKMPSLSANEQVIVNHTDCDSIISSLTMSNLLPPIGVFGQAVIAADHSGEENEISDLLQAIEFKRDLRFSSRNLAKLLMGEALEPAAEKLVHERSLGRIETSSRIMDESAVVSSGDLAVVNITGNMRNEFMPALFPQSSVILTLENGDTPGHHIARLRLGLGAPVGFTLFNVPLRELDPNYGGRWNAGSNRRGGGLTESPVAYIARFENAVKKALDRFA